MTRSGMTLGTLAYMSPEQVRGEEIDARSDIFSFGLLLYEKVTGMHPFRRENAMETASAILHEEPRLAGAIATGIPADLEKLIERCLRKDARRRVQHMDDVKLAMEEIKAHLDSGRKQVTPAATKRITSVRLAAGAVAVGALIGAGWYWLSRQRPSGQEVPVAVVPLTSYPGSEGTLHKWR